MAKQASLIPEDSADETEPKKKDQLWVMKRIRHYLDALPVHERYGALAWLFTTYGVTAKVEPDSKVTIRPLAGV